MKGRKVGPLEAADAAALAGASSIAAGIWIAYGLGQCMIAIGAMLMLAAWAES